MATFLWACWDGGGQIPPSLGIARRLAARGHEVVFAGQATMVPRVAAAGFEGIELRTARDQQERYAWHPLGAVLGFLTSPVVGEEVLGLTRARRPDAVILDAKFSAAHCVAPELGMPSAVMLHSYFHRSFGSWLEHMRYQSSVRMGSGFPALPSIAQLWGAADLVQVNTLRELDGPDRTRFSTVRHGGPILELDPRGAEAADAPTAEPPGTDPLVVVSFSTAESQADADKLQRALDALAPLPVRVVATTAMVDPQSLRVPANARAVRFASHDELIRRARLVITHGGHGTAMRALAHGVNLLCVTAFDTDGSGRVPLDQAHTAVMAEELGVGRFVPADASPERIREVAAHLLGSDPCHANARHTAGLLAEVDGAGVAADRLEALADGWRPALEPLTPAFAALG